MHRHLQSAIVVTATVVLSCTFAFAHKEFKLPRPEPARMYPAHDEHPQEHVTIAVDPYDEAGKASVFRTKWREHGLLPVLLVISNDSDRPITLTGMKVVLVTSRRVKLQPATNDDVYRRITRTMSRGDEPSRNPTPLPFPRRGPRVGVSKETRQELEAAQFRALAVDPHAAQSGFLFFDVEGIRDPLAGAHVYITGICDGNGQDLMYFEIPLDNYLNAPAGQPGAASGRMAPTP